MPQSYRQPLSWIALASLFALVLAGSGSSGAPASASLLPPGALAPLERQKSVAKRIGMILEEAHYRHAQIDDRMSEQVFDRYLDSLDGQRSYLLSSDVQELSAFRLRFDDMIHTGNVEPAYLIFARFQQRNRERIRYAMKLLEKEPDWTINESFDFDRAKQPWVASTADLDELWRKRVKADGLSLVLAGKSWAEAADTLKKRYERVLKRVDEVRPEDVFENLMNAYARTYDPHSNYFGARNSEEYRIQMSLSYEGIGATLQSQDDYVQIVNILPGGPAAVAGTLSINDRITAIAQGKGGAFQEVIGWRLDDVVQLIRGRNGTLVRLQVLPAGATPGTPEKVIEFTRGKVTLENQAAKKEKRLVSRNGRNYGIGVITVPGFYQDVQAQSQGEQDYRSTTRDVRRLIEEFQKEGGIDGLVLDLRGDGGGYLPEATALTGLFIDKGPVVQLKDYTGRVEVLEDPNPGIVYDGPLVVLVDRASASASEIFAGAIQDYHRGYVIGQRTFGKGTVQNLVPLDRWSQRPVDGQLTVTIGKFYRVTGESTQHRGVEPDIPLPSPISLEDVGESALEAALPWDRIAAVPFQTLRQPTSLPTANVLMKDEGARTQKDPNYRWLVSDISAFETQRKQKTLSLNLVERKAERDRLDAESLARENQRLSQQGQPVLKSNEELQASAEKRPDIVLEQTAQILGDILAAPPVSPTPAVARDSHEGTSRKPAPKTSND